MMTYAMAKVPSSYEQYVAWRESFLPGSPQVTIADAQIILYVDSITFAAYSALWRGSQHGKVDTLDRVYDAIYKHRHDLVSERAMPKSFWKPRAHVCSECGAFIFTGEFFERGHKERCPHVS